MRLLILALMTLELFGPSWAKADDSKKNDEEYNFNWLDPDKKIYVLQNRKYLKGGHPILSVLGGVGFSNPYASTYNLDGRFAFYITEVWGIEAFYTYTVNSPNSTLQALGIAAPNTLPNVRQIRAQFGGQLHYVPWYAKINVFNSILYFDWYFAAGGGNIQTFVDTRTSISAASNFVEQDAIGMFFSTGQNYHLSQSFIFRIDVTGAFYQVPVNGLSGSTSWYSNYNIGAGLGWKI